MQAYPKSETPKPVTLKPLVQARIGPGVSKTWVLGLRKGVFLIFSKYLVGVELSCGYEDSDF